MRLVKDLMRFGLLAATIVGCGSPGSTEAGIGGASLPGGTSGGGQAGGQAGGNPGAGLTGGGQVGGIAGGTNGGSPAGGGITSTMVTPGGAGGGPAGNNTCQITSVDFLGDAPDMLIVLDRSLSMSLNFRWDPSKDAVNQITRDFEGLIAFGLSMFPGAGATDPLEILLGGANACGGGGMLDVPMMVRNSMPIAQAMNGSQTMGLTPTGPALQAAGMMLGNRMPGLDVRVKPGYVLLITDGDPSCDPTLSLSIPPGADTVQQAAALEAVTALHAAGIPTYVMGFQIDPAFTAFMTQMATAGGTDVFYPVENAQGIIDAFRQITKDVVRCDFQLGMAPPDPTFVRIEIDNMSIPYDDPNGWTLANGTHVTLHGAACDGLKDGKVHNLNAQIECNPVILN